MNSTFNLHRNDELLSPLIIGATGGSGTRVLGQILIAAGAYLGHDLNRACDSLSLTPFVATNLKQAFLHMQEHVVSSPANWHASFDSCLITHMKQYSGHDLWGWKNPTSMHYLPFFHSKFPNLKFVHVVRDGRDMALSRNHRQFNAIYDGEHSCNNITTGMASLWSAANSRVADYGGGNLGANYHLLRYEDLCKYPAETIKAFFRFIGIFRDEKEFVDFVGNQGQISRYLDLPELEQKRVTDVAKTGLRKFNYI